MNMLLFMLYIFIISCLIFFLPLMFLKKKKEIFQIEGGFENLMKTSMKNFSVNFFFILILFVIFDLELILLIPLIFSMNFLSSLISIMFVIFTLWVEWGFNKINWNN